MGVKQDDVGLLLAPTYRSKAILQTFEALGIKIGNAVILPGDEPIWEGDENIGVPLYQHEKTLHFRPSKSIKSSLKETEISYSYAPTSDINTDEFIGFIKSTTPSIYIYSGIAGCILRSDIINNSDKKFIHAHGGDAPRYSGSTAFYYSILECNLIGATAFWMDEGLDTGDVINKLISPPHTEIEIDRIQDPIIRAEALASAFKQITDECCNAHIQDHSQRVTYHVIHPILKHLALAKCGLKTK